MKQNTLDIFSVERNDKNKYKMKIKQKDDEISHIIITRDSLLDLVNEVIYLKDGCQADRITICTDGIAVGLYDLLSKYTTLNIDSYSKIKKKKEAESVEFETVIKHPNGIKLRISNNGIQIEGVAKINFEPHSIITIE